MCIRDSAIPCTADMTEAEVKGAYELETGNVIVKRFEGLNPVHTPVSYTHLAGFSMCLLNTVVNPMLNKLGGEGNKGKDRKSVV